MNKDTKHEMSSTAGAARQGGVTSLEGLTKYDCAGVDGLVADDNGRCYLVAEVERLLAALATPIPPSTAPAPQNDDKHLPGWERGIATVTLSGHQLRMALDLINPDGPSDDLQLDDELTFGIVQHKDDDGNVSTGMCCWNDDTDGVLPLDGEYEAAPAPQTDLQSLLIEQAARAMAKQAGWDKWDTATDCRHTPSGNDPDDERDYFRDLARAALSVAAPAPDARQSVNPQQSESGK